MDKKIAVIAGSGVDTQMGVDVLEAAGIAAYAYPAASEAREQTEFQMQSVEVRTEKIRSIMKKAIADGMDAIMIYCNSLSSTIDMPALGKELNIKVVTPLMAYGEYAKKYNYLAVLAGNNQGLAGIERAIMGGNIKSTVLGAALLPMVVEVEKRTPPQEIIDKFALMSLFDYYYHCGAEAFILGCTHFPWIKEALIPQVKIPVLDPADSMVEMLME